MRISSLKIIASVFCGVFMFLSCSQYSEKDTRDSAGRPEEIVYPRAVINVNIADLKKEPRKHTDRVSQALYNEVVEIIKKSKTHVKIRQGDGYEGWIESYYLDDAIDFSGKSPFIVDNYLAPAYEKQDNNSDRKTMFPYGCRLQGSVEGDYLCVESKRYGIVYVELSDLIEEVPDLYAAKPDSASICREAGKFIGAPYLWGGKSFYGVDCSGLTQIVMKRFGINLFRDSKDQMTQGVRIDRQEVRAGDLLFFPHHVGLAVSKDLMIHSTNENGGVAFNSLNPESPIYSEYHDKNFIMARRVAN